MRILAVAALLFLGALVLLPALMPPARFVELLTHDSQRCVWPLGSERADAIAQRAASLVALLPELDPGEASPPDSVSRGLARLPKHIAALEYVTGVRRLLDLTAWRFAAATEWLQVGLPMLLAALVDAFAVRQVRLSAHSHPSPMSFGIAIRGGMAVTALAGLSLLAPWPLPDLFVGATGVLLTLTLWAAVVDFQRVR